jgi:hypothetical protein
MGHNPAGRVISLSLGIKQASRASSGETSKIDFGSDIGTFH